MANWRFGAFPKLPYSTMQQLNLDWILDRIRRFLPDNGTKGQVLTRTKDGAAWADPEAASGAVSSVNGKTGAVVLDAEDVGALPDTYVAPVTSVNGQTGDVVISGGGAVDSVNGKTGNVILTASDVGAMPDSYTAPVQAVNGKTGNVTLDAEDVGALPDTYTAPVTSVNGKTGAAVLDASDVGALPDSYAPSFGTRKEITLPFTTTESGFFEGRLRTNNQGRAYANFIGSTTFDAIIDGYNVANGYITQSFPLKAGVTIPVPTTNNVYQAAYYWTPLI